MATALPMSCWRHPAPVGTAPMLRGRHGAWQANIDDHSESIHVQLQKNPTSRCPLTAHTATSLGDLPQQYLWGNKIMVTTHLSSKLMLNLSYLYKASWQWYASNNEQVCYAFTRKQGSSKSALTMKRRMDGGGDGWQRLWVGNRWQHQHWALLVSDAPARYSSQRQLLSQHALLNQTNLAHAQEWSLRRSSSHTTF